MKLFVTILLLFIGPYAWTQETLTEFVGNRERAVQDYDNKVKALEPGQVIKFSSGVEFTLGALLGQGNNVYVWSVKENPDLAIRLPKKKYDATATGSFDDLFLDLSLYSSGNKQLIELGINAVEVKKYGYGYSLVNKINRSVSFNDFMSMAPGRLRKQLESQFIEFIEPLKAFEFLGEFYHFQVVYDLDSEKWVLLDWASERTRPYSPENIYAKDPLSSFVSSMYGFKEGSGGQFLTDNQEKKWIEKLLNEARDHIKLMRGPRSCAVSLSR